MNTRVLQCSIFYRRVVLQDGLDFMHDASSRLARSPPRDGRARLGADRPSSCAGTRVNATRVHAWILFA